MTDCVHSDVGICRYFLRNEENKPISYRKVVSVLEIKFELSSEN